jgi:hypothetical protein
VFEELWGKLLAFLQLLKQTARNTTQTASFLLLASPFQRISVSLLDSLETKYCRYLPSNQKAVTSLLPNLADFDPVNSVGCSWSPFAGYSSSDIFPCCLVRSCVQRSWYIEQLAYRESLPKDNHRLRRLNPQDCSYIATVRGAYVTSTRWKVRTGESRSPDKSRSRVRLQQALSG